MKKNGFTLVEVTITLAVFLILTTVGITGYSKLLDIARQKVSTGNLLSIGVAVEAYVAENSALPATLGDLKLEHLERGYARVMEESDWRMKLSLFLVKLNIPNKANAAFLTHDNLKKYGVKEAIFHDPADTNGGASYGINGALEGISWEDIGDDTLIISSSDSYVINSASDIAYRYGGGLFGAGDTALAVTKDIAIAEMDISNASDEEVTSNFDTITICHDPTKKKGKKKKKKKKTETVTPKKLQKHLDHGDSLGACAN